MKRNIFNKVTLIAVLMLIVIPGISFGQTGTNTVQTPDETVSGNSPDETVLGQQPSETVSGQEPDETVTGGTSPTPSSSGIFTIQNPLKVDSIGGLINLFVELFTYLVILLAVLMFIYVGFKYVLYSSQGNTKGISELHGQLFWLVVGVAVVIGARFIIEIIINTLSATGAISPGVIDSANNAIRPK